MKKWFPLAGNNYVRNPNVPGGLSQIDNKTLQWFGATVSASIKDGGPILVSKLFNKNICKKEKAREKKETKQNARFIRLFKKKEKRKEKEKCILINIPFFYDPEELMKIQKR